MPTINYPEKTTNFVERTSLQEKIKRELEKNKKVIVSGLEGAGKSCLAIELGRQLAEQENAYAAVIFIDCETIKTNTDSDIRKLILDQIGSMKIKINSGSDDARKIQLDSSVLYKKNHILYVFDGVEQPDEFVNNLPGYIRNQSYIITTRQINKDNGLRAKLNFPNTVMVGSFNSDEAVQYIKEELGEEHTKDISDSKLQYIAAFGYNYPLWLKELTANLDKQTRHNINNFISETIKSTYDIKPLDVDLDEKFLLIDRNYPLDKKIDYNSNNYEPINMIEKAMAMPFINYYNNNPVYKTQLHKLLSYLSLLFSKNIPYVLLKQLIPNNEMLDELINYLETHGVISRTDLRCQSENVPTMYNISPLFQFIWRNNLTDEQQTSHLTDAIRYLSQSMDEAVNANQKTAIHHAYAMHIEVLAYHGYRNEIDPLTLASITSKLAKYHSDSLSMVKAVEFYTASISNYEKWAISCNITLDSITPQNINQISPEQRRQLINFVKICNELCTIKINIWNRESKNHVLNTLTIAKNILEALNNPNNDLLTKVKINLARVHRKLGNYADASTIYNEISAHNVNFNIDSKIALLMSNSPVSHKKIKLIKTYSDTLIKIARIADLQNRNIAFNNLETAYNTALGSSRKGVVTEFRSKCREIKYSAGLRKLEEADKLKYYERLAYYRLNILRLYLERESTDKDYEHMLLLCHDAANSCKKYFKNLRIEDVNGLEQSPLLNLDTAKIFFQVAKITLEIYNRRKNTVNPAAAADTDGATMTEELRKILHEDNYCKGYLSIAFQMCNLGIVTHRTLNLSPTHPYSVKMTKLKDNIFSQVGVESISSKLNWSAENHKVDGKKSALFDEKSKLYKKTENPEERQNLRLSLGNLAIMLGQYKKAIQFFIEHLDFDLKNSSINIEVLKKLGCAYYCAKEYDKAVATFTQVLEYYPTDFNAIKWLTAARNEMEQGKNQKLRDVNESTHLSQFIKGFKEEFVRKVQVHKDRLTGKNKIDQNASLRMFSALAKYLPDVNIAPPNAGIGLDFHLGDATQKTLEELIAIRKAEQETQNFYVSNFSEEVIKTFSDTLLSDTQRLMNAVHNIACTVADGLPNILNRYSYNSMTNAGAGIAQRIIYHFANNLNDINMPLDDQISLAVFTGKCDKDIDLFRSGHIRPHLLDNIIRKSGLITPTGEVYKRRHSKIEFKHSFPFFTGVTDKLSPRPNDQRNKYGYRIGPLLHQMVTDYKPVNEGELFGKGNIGLKIEKALEPPHQVRSLCLSH